METLSHADILVLSHVLSEIYCARDLDSFYMAIRRHLRLVVPYDYSTFKDINPLECAFLTVEKGLETDQGKSEICFPVASLDAPDHPLIPYCLSGSVINVSDCALLHDFSGMPVYEEYCRHLGGNKQIAFSILVADKKVTLIALNKKLGNFTNRDRYVLGLLRTHMICAVRNVILRSRIQHERDVLQQMSEHGQSGVLFVQSEGRIVCVPDFATKYMENYFKKPFAEGDVLPNELLLWFQAESQLLKQNKLCQIETRTILFPFSDATNRLKSLAIYGGNIRFTLKLLNVGAVDEYTIFIAVTDYGDLMSKMKKFGLSNRETEVLLWISQGKSNKETSLILQMSRRTVEKHLERIFAKLGVDSRALAVAIIRDGLM